MKIGDTVMCNTIKRHSKSGKTYCNIGDKIKILAIHGDVLICETKKDRISINKKDVKL